VRARLEQALAQALAEMNLVARVRVPRGAHVIAIGKASGTMMKGALVSSIAGGLVVAPDDAPVPLDPRVTVLRASHPVPDARSVRAAMRCFEIPHPRVVLVSGGASALVCAPAGVSLSEKKRITGALLSGGASVREINIVRKHLSRIKGGGLHAALTLIASDVIGGAATDIGSGPSVRDPTGARDARKILQQYAPHWAKVPLVRRKPPPPGRARIIASPEEHAQIVARILAARVLAASETDVHVLADEYAGLAAQLRPGEALVRAAEPSLVVRARGRGGRATHLATLVALRLPPGVTFFAAATDGVDGASGTAGAIVDASLTRRASADAIATALRAFDTGPLHIALGTARPMKPTGQNFTDVHVLARRR
jgi:glycerate 2-kinase